MRKFTIQQVLLLPVLIALFWSSFHPGIRNLSFALQIIALSIMSSGQSPRWPFWKILLVAMCGWGLIDLLFTQDLSEVTRFILAGLLLIIILFMVFPVIAFFRRKKARLEHGDLVLFYPNRIRKREPVAKIASYRFHLVWFLELTMKDHSIRMLELPSLSWKPVIQKIMLEAGVPVSER